MSKPHLLYIAFAFPPSTASSVYRCTAVANAFAEDGWDVTVLTLDSNIWSEISGVDQKLADSVDPRIRIVQVDDGGSEEPARGDLRRFSRLRIEAPYVWKEVMRRRGRKDFPEDFHGAWSGPRQQSGAGSPRRQAGRSGHGVREPLCRVRGRPLPGGGALRHGLPRCLGLQHHHGAEDFDTASERGKLEAQFLAEAAGSWFVNDQIRDEYAARYPESAATMRVVPNGFDPQPGHAAPGIRRTQHPRFGYLGTRAVRQHADGRVPAGVGYGISWSRFQAPRRCSGASSALRERLAPRSLRPSVPRRGTASWPDVRGADFEARRGPLLRLGGRTPVVAVHRKVRDRRQDRRVSGDGAADRLGTRSGQCRHGAAPRLSVVVSGQGPLPGEHRRSPGRNVPTRWLIRTAPRGMPPGYMASSLPAAPSWHPSFRICATSWATRSSGRWRKKRVTPSYETDRKSPPGHRCGPQFAPSGHAGQPLEPGFGVR